MAAFSDDYDHQRDDDPRNEEDCKHTETEASISDEICIQVSQFIWLRCIDLIIASRNGIYPEISKEASMHPPPSEVKLRKSVAWKQIDKLEEIVCLSKNQQIVNFIKKPVSYV